MHAIYIYAYISVYKGDVHVHAIGSVTLENPEQYRYGDKQDTYCSSLD